jgi:hypothetical protein
VPGPQGRGARSPGSWAAVAREGHLPGCGELQRPPYEARPLPAPHLPYTRQRPRPEPPCQAQTHAKRGRRCRQGLVVPSPSAPPPRPRQRGPLGPRVRGSFVPPVSGLGTLASFGGGPHGGRPRCGRAVRLQPGPGCGGWAQRWGRTASSLRPGHGRAGSARAGNPTRLPGAAHPARPGRGRKGMGGGGRAGVVGEGPWGPQGRVPGPSALP